MALRYIYAILTSLGPENFIISGPISNYLLHLGVAGIKPGPLEQQATTLSITLRPLGHVKLGVPETFTKYCS